MDDTNHELFSEIVPLLLQPPPQLCLVILHFILIRERRRRQQICFYQSLQFFVLYLRTRRLANKTTLGVSATTKLVSATSEQYYFWTTCGKRTFSYLDVL